MNVAVDLLNLLNLLFVTQDVTQGVSQGCMVFYDITEHQSFENLSVWMREIQEASPFKLYFLLI